MATEFEGNDQVPKCQKPRRLQIAEWGQGRGVAGGKK